MPNPPKINYILAIDPGGVRTGYALFEHEGKEPDSVLLQSGIIHFDDLTEFLRTKHYATYLVYERYVIRPGNRNTGSTGKVMQVIGKLDMWAQTLKIPVSTQDAGILPIAHKITGYPKPKGHLPDDKSAWLHGVYWLRKKGWYLSALEREKAS